MIKQWRNYGILDFFDNKFLTMKFVMLAKNFNLLEKHPINLN